MENGEWRMENGEWKMENGKGVEVVDGLFPFDGGGRL